MDEHALEAIRNDLIRLESRLPQALVPQSWIDVWFDWIEHIVSSRSLRALADALVELEMQLHIMERTWRWSSSRMEAWRRRVRLLSTCGQLSTHIKVRLSLCRFV